MAKKKPDKTKKQPKASGKIKSFGLDFINKHPNFLPLAILCFLATIFFNEVLFGGKTFLPPDAIASKSARPFIFDSFKNGVYPLWNPNIFSGMPSFASLQAAPYVDLIGNVLHLISKPITWIWPEGDFVRALFNFLIIGFATYILIMKKTGTRGIALFACVAMSFQPQVIAFVAFGHGTKLTTASLIPLVFLLLDQLLEKKQLKYFALFALTIGLQLLRAHTQMAYYTFMMIGLYLIFWIIHSKVKKADWGQIFKPVGLTVVALIIGVAMSSWLYISVLEYADYSIRGGSSGLDYGYATSWSFAPKEIVTFFIPSFLGFGGQTYWGGMPFTDFPLYMGIIPLMLGCAALVIRRDKYTIFFTLMGVLALLVSFGKDLPVLYGLLFKFLPFFNKFRVPSMILILLQFSVVTLAAFSLSQLFQLEKQARHDRLRKFLYVFVGICGAAMLFMLVAKSTYIGWISSSGKQLGIPIQQAAYDMAVADSVKIFFIALAGAVLVVRFTQKKIGRTVFLTAITALTVLDLWLVDFKITEPQPKTDQTQYFAETDAVRFLKNIEEPFRIYQAYDNKAPNWYMYHKIQNIQGYHAAKLRNYQTFLANSGLEGRNRFGLPGFLSKYYRVLMNNGQPTLQVIESNELDKRRVRKDNAILDMLNVKYLISYYQIPDPRYKLVMNGKPSVYENTGVLPRAFFVDSVKVIDNEDIFYDSLRSGAVVPSKVAFLKEEPPFRLGLSENNSVAVTSYGLHEIEIEAQVREPSLLVLSEIYYPAGWKAYVDGTETRIYKTNAILRSIFLQPGEHTIRFVFHPRAFYAGLGISSVTLFMMLGLLFYQWKFKARPSQAKNR